MKKVYINENFLSNAISGKLLPQFLFKSVKTHSTSLGDSEAFPSGGVYPFDYILLKNRFNDVYNEINAIGLDSLEEDYLISKLSELISRCRELERPIRNILERICENALNRLFAIPREMVIMSFNLVDKIKFKNAIRVNPDNGNSVGFTFKDIEDIDHSNKAIEKRRFIDSLIQGASYMYANIIGLYAYDIENINGELLSLYREIRIINDYLLFVKEEKITDDKPMQGSYVETKIGIDGDKSEINVQGLIFPFLLQESIRGLFELFSLHGLPDDKNKAQYIIKSADFILAEPWDMRLGVGLWKALFNSVGDTNLVPYVFTYLVKLPTDEFNMSVKEILSNTDKGSDIMASFVKKAEYDDGYQQFTNRINAKNLNKSMINDSYFSGAETNGYELGSTDDDSDVIEEDGDNINESVLVESQESKSIAQAKRLVMQRLNYNEQEADEFIRFKLRNDIPILRTPQGAKFILGAARMFCDGELRTANDIGNLNSTLKLVASDAHINEYDRNLNGLSFNDLIQRFAKAMSDNLEAERAEVGKMQFNGSSDYQIVRIDSFKQARKYGKYTSWCVTHQRNMFDSYTSDGINQFYFCLKNSFENVEKTPSEGCPLDEYGLSMIAISVNENGMLNTCTCRWNHDNGGDDSIMNTKQISQVIGMNFFEVFKPNGKWNALITNVKQRLANGEDPREVFDDYEDFNEGFAAVGLNGKYNFINKNGEFLSKQWFDYCEDFHEGFARVILNNKYNFIRKNGEFLSDKWFNWCEIFYEGFARVKLNGEHNFIRKNGEFLSEQWFDACGNFHEGFAMVGLNGKYNFINKNGELLSEQWFDYCRDFNEGFAIIKINNKWNFINKNVEFLSDEWFESCGSFNEGFAVVKLNGKWNFINKDAEFLSEQWFDDCTRFNEGFAMVYLNRRCYRINKNGELYLYRVKQNS